MYQKLMNRDFSLVVIGQIISLFGNSILRFALPLYLLDQTGSSALFGSVLAISMIPMILFSPIAGMVADRVNRRNIMVILDFSTAALVAVFGLLHASGNPAVLVAIMLICLSVIQAFYQPAVQASIPVLSSTNNLLRANAIINQVQSLSNLIGPILGGMLYSVWGVVPVIWASAASFLFSAVMEIFIHIPFEKRAASGGILTTAVNDLKESLHFMIRERPVILRVVIFVSLFNLALSSLITVGVPSMVKITLHLSSSLYSLTQVLLAAGALCGGILAGILAPKLSLRNMHWVLFLASLCLLPIGISLALGASIMVSYVVITTCGFVFMGLGTLFSVMMLAFLQKETPRHLIGKVLSYVVGLSICSQPVGQALYGFLFDALVEQPQWILFVAVVFSVIVSLISKKTFAHLEESAT